MTLPDISFYYTLRTIARETVANSINRKVAESGGCEIWGNLIFASINADALHFARTEWPKYYSSETHNGFILSWEKLFYKFAPRPAHFDLAIWQIIKGQKVLQGLALGKPSDGKRHLTIEWVERSFAPTYLRSGILLPVLACAEEYAKLLGCEKVLIKDPVDPSKYERYGYVPYKMPNNHGIYLCKDFAS